MSRIQALLTAGALTGLVIVALFWYRTSDTASAVTSTVAATPVTIMVADDTATPDLHLLLAQNQQLRETVTTLLNREEAYRQQIEAANQQMLATQEHPATDSSTTGRLFQGEDDDEHEEDEHEEDENEGHEREEHEEYEHEGHDDDD
jgi:hypothetical protein